MFRAVDLDGHDVISLLISSGAVETYHSLAVDDCLLCPECRQAVWFKAGEIREYHFAHKDRGKCPMGSESPALLRARAALFRLLSSRFGAAVTVEKSFEGLPRAVDCYVATAEGLRWGYWLIESRLPERYQIRDRLGAQGIHIHWVFLADLMQRNNKPKDILNLTPTERELLAASPFDALYRNRPASRWTGSIHYLDAETGRFTSFRAMDLTEYPQEHTGTEIGCALDAVEIVATSGEWAHPGEVARLQAYEEEKRVQAEAKRLQEAERQRAAEGEKVRERRATALAEPVARQSIPKGLNVYEMYWANGNAAGFWIRHCRWAGRCAQVKRIREQADGPLDGHPPFHGHPPVLVDIYDAHTGQLLEAASPLDAAGSYDYRLLVPPAWMQ